MAIAMDVCFGGPFSLWFEGELFGGGQLDRRIRGAASCMHKSNDAAAHDSWPLINIF